MNYDEESERGEERDARRGLSKGRDCVGVNYGEVIGRKTRPPTILSVMPLGEMR